MSGVKERFERMTDRFAEAIENNEPESMEASALDERVCGLGNGPPIAVMPSDVRLPEDGAEASQLSDPHRQCGLTHITDRRTAGRKTR